MTCTGNMRNKVSHFLPTNRRKRNSGPTTRQHPNRWQGNHRIKAYVDNGGCNTCNQYPKSVFHCKARIVLVANLWLVFLAYGVATGGQDAWRNQYEKTFRNGRITHNERPNTYYLSRRHTGPTGPAHTTKTRAVVFGRTIKVTNYAGRHRYRTLLAKAWQNDTRYRENLFRRHFTVHRNIGRSPRRNQ